MVEEQYDSKGARLGAPLDPLKPDYRLWKLKQGKGEDLVLTGGLKDSFQGRGRWAIRDTRKTSAKFGSRHPLAHIHQHGTAGGKIPSRPILIIRPDVKEGDTKIVADYMHGRDI